MSQIFQIIERIAIVEAAQRKCGDAFVGDNVGERLGLRVQLDEQLEELLETPLELRTAADQLRVLVVEGADKRLAVDRFAGAL